MVNTKTVTDRRTLSFSCMDDLLRDLEGLDGGAIRATGNWSPAQIVQHVGKLIGFSLDGFPPGAKAPLLLRLLGPMLKGRFLGRPFPGGITIPDTLAMLRPDDAIEWADALGAFRALVARTRDESMTARSPLFGRMTNEDWVKVHCRHAEMHFSFMQAD
jgi:hypothetical protein